MARQEMTVTVEHKADGTATAKLSAYALALLAINESRGGIEVAQEASWTGALSDQDAHDYGMEIARSKWPSAEGWQHQVAIRKVNMVIDLLKKSE